MPIAARIISLSLEATLSAVIEVVLGVEPTLTAQTGCAASDEIVDDALLKG
jgi:hypothetical protein